MRPQQRQNLIMYVNVHSSGNIVAVYKFDTCDLEWATWRELCIMWGSSHSCLPLLTIHFSTDGTWRQETSLWKVVKVQYTCQVMAAGVPKEGDIWAVGSHLIEVLWLVCGGDREYVVPASSLCGLACHIMDGVLMVGERLELECRLCSRYLLLVLKFKMLICMLLRCSGFRIRTQWQTDSYLWNPKTT